MSDSTQSLFCGSPQLPTHEGDEGFHMFPLFSTSPDDDPQQQVEMEKNSISFSSQPTSKFRLLHKISFPPPTRSRYIQFELPLCGTEAGRMKERRSAWMRNWQNLIHYARREAPLGMRNVSFSRRLHSEEEERKLISGGASITSHRAILKVKVHPNPLFNQRSSYAGKLNEFSEFPDVKLLAFPLEFSN